MNIRYRPWLIGLACCSAIAWLLLELWPLLGTLPVAVTDTQGRVHLLRRADPRECDAIADRFARERLGLSENMHACCVISGRRLEAQCACSLHKKPDCSFSLLR